MASDSPNSPKAQVKTSSAVAVSNPEYRTIPYQDIGHSGRSQVNSACAYKRTKYSCLESVVAQPSYLPATIREIPRSPILASSVQSCSPCLLKLGSLSARELARLSTAGCGAPEALSLMATKASKPGVAFGSLSSAAFTSRAKSRCGATPWWAPLTGERLYRSVYKPGLLGWPRRS